MRVLFTRGALAVLSLMIAAASSAAAPTERTVVVLLVNGWAPALLDMFPAPTLERLRNEGAWTHHLLPPFPSSASTSQASVSTGCWPEHHGILSDEFLDPTRGRYERSRDADWLAGCEGLHQVAERQGVRSAALWWFGHSSSARGKLATYVAGDEAGGAPASDTQRAARVIELLRLPDEQRPRLILADLDDLDAAEHRSGMNSDETRAVMARSDAAVGALLEAIRGLPIKDRTSLIVMSDHGMLPVWTHINVAKILRHRGIEATAMVSGTTAFLYFRRQPDTDEAVRKLVDYYKYFDVFPKWLPSADWHLGQGVRAPDLVLSAIPPSFMEDVSDWPFWSRWAVRLGPELLGARVGSQATHGYPTKTKGMPGLLYAWGAGIASGKQVVNVRAIDVHPTVCRLLGIAPGSPLDGKVADDLLAPEQAAP